MAALAVALCTITVNVVTQVNQQGIPVTVRLAAKKQDCPPTRVIFNPTLETKKRYRFSYQPPYVCWIPNEPPRLTPGVVPLPEPDKTYPDPL
jgi:hypothetical protein